MARAAAIAFGAVGAVAAAGLAAWAPAASAPAGEEAVAEHARPLTGTSGDYDALVHSLGDSRVVLLGEDTHGTHEFYAERARITQRLIAERRFRAVAIEGEWGDARRVDAYVRGRGGDRSAEQALGDFRSFGRWMWANEPFAAFLEWLRDHNARLPEHARVGVYGIDAQDLLGAVDAALSELRAVDAALAARARAQYACFARWRATPETYGAFPDESGHGCAEAAAAVARDLRDGRAPFAALQSARLVVAAERNARARHRGGTDAWNLRDRQMADVVDAVAAHVRGGVVAWAHNTHVGDARATDLYGGDGWSVGHLLRERHAARVALVGFTTARGTVTAAPAWDARPRTFELGTPVSGSHGALLGARDAVLVLRGNDALRRALADARPQRAIGVVYDRAGERRSHYVEARLAEQFDAVVHLGRTRAVSPLRP
ncbi:MAG TPA: erythromycin esterase family protein [Gaiellaceae bacterium]|nr:erythromycin esterase family protein [Gaiellaceae bacterium]